MRGPTLFPSYTLLTLVVSSVAVLLATTLVFLSSRNAPAHLPPAAQAPRERERETYGRIPLSFEANRSQTDPSVNFLAPGADPRAVSLRFEGADKLDLDANGDLLLKLGESVVRQPKPFVYQEVASARREVEAGYVLDADGRVRFVVGEYDRSATLVIDPTLVYSTYLGGSNDSGEGIKVDAAGNAQVGGILTTPHMAGPVDVDGDLTAQKVIADLSESVGLRGNVDGTNYETLINDGSVDIDANADEVHPAAIVEVKHGAQSHRRGSENRAELSAPVKGVLPDVVVYASNNGVVMDSNLESGGGTDNTAAMQALLDLAPALGSVHIVNDGPALVGALNYHGNTTVECTGGGGFYLKDATNRAMFRNANPVGSGAVTDKHIRFINCTFNGNAVNQVGIGAYNRREVDGTLIGLVQLYGVEDVKVLNCTFINSKSIALHFSNATNFLVEDCYIDSNLLGEYQQGGCQVEGPASNFTIRRLKGSTQDDLVGIASNDNVYVEGPFTGIGPYVAGGDITDWSVLDLQGIGKAFSGVRLFNPGASANRIDRGLIDGVTGTFTLAVLWNEPGGVYNPAHGNIGTVTLRNVNVHMLDTVLPAITIPGGRGGVMLYNSIDNLILENINFNDPEDNRSHLYIDRDCDIKSLYINGFNVFDTVDNGSTAMFLLDNGARLRNGNFRNINWVRGSSHARAATLMQINAGCTVDNLFINGLYANRVDDIIRRQCATTTNNLMLRNVRHIGATSSGNATVSNTAGTISLLDMSCWFSDAASRTYEVGGTITTKRGDAFVTQITDTTTGPASQLAFTQTAPSVQEDVTSLTLTVQRTGDVSGAVTVDYATADGSASERRDYTTALGTLRFAANETAKTIDLLVNEDSFVEGNETFTVALSNPTGGATLSCLTAVATVQITDDAVEPTTNVIDDTNIFVGTHYHDFLNRQADTPGLNFWAGQLTPCGTDAACLDRRRTDVSQAFFLSIEFQRTGFLVHRFYKASFQDSASRPRGLARYREFLRDTQEIGRGVVVNQAGWEQLLEANKQEFTRRWVQRADFLAEFPAGMSFDAYVAKLAANSGTTLTPDEINLAFESYSDTVQGRANALRAVLESRSVYNAQFNTGFVLSQYIGYLRRNPNDAPDTGYTGFDSWLTKLNSFSLPGEDVRNEQTAIARANRAEMVRAFLSSLEYRGRFGQ